MMKLRHSKRIFLYNQVKFSCLTQIIKGDF